MKMYVTSYSQLDDLSLVETIKKDYPENNLVFSYCFLAEINHSAYNPKYNSNNAISLFTMTQNNISIVSRILRKQDI